MLVKVLAVSMTLGCVFIWAQVIPNNEFESNLNDWYGMFDAWYPGNIGTLEWRDTYGGSAYLEVDGSPDVIGMWTTTRGTISQGEEVYTYMFHSNLTSIANIRFTIGGEPPYGQQVVHSDSSGFCTLSIIADRTYPAGTPIWIRFTVWPGNAFAYIWYVSTTAGIEENNTKTAINSEKTVSFPCLSKGSAKIFYELKQKSNVTIVIQDASGKSVRVVNEGLKTHGKYDFFFDGKDDHGVILSAGTYFYTIKADGRILTNKVLILK